MDILVYLASIKKKLTKFFRTKKKTTFRYKTRLGSQTDSVMLKKLGSLRKDPNMVSDNFYGHQFINGPWKNIE